ncbi:MAG: hypothetical protein V4568_15875 [Pseudomonadota bacterium]
MKRFLCLAALVVATTPAFAADVGVSVQIGDPGFYGRIDIGSFPPPPVVYRQPVVIRHVEVVQEPIYLRVPPGHAKKWRKHCHKYNACGRPVYFVQDTWYQQEYVPQYRERHGHGDRRDGYRGDDDRGEKHGHGHGNGNGNGKGHGKGHKDD